MIKTSIMELIDTVEIMDQVIKQPLQGSLALKVARLAREANKEIETFYKVRDGILKKYCELNDDGSLAVNENGNAQVRQDSIQQCNQELQSVINTEITLNVEPLPATLLDYITLTAQQASQIQVFFE